MTKDEKLRIARQLERLRVDVIEAGFAASSNGDFECVKAIAEAVKDSTICSLARANDRDISRAAEALKPANSGRLHLFLATSPLHMEKKLRMTPDQVFEAAKLAVRFAKNACPDVEFSPEDGSRSESDFLCRVLEAVIKEGATTINIPDTVGYAVPQQFGEVLRKLPEKIPKPNKAVVGANAFAHASGIHQDGVLKARQTYEIMRAEDVGWSTNKIVLGKLSGRNAFKQRLKELGIDLESEDAYNKAFQRFKDLADKKADIFDEDLLALVAQEAGASGEEHWQLVTMSQASGMGEKPHAHVVLKENGTEKKS